MPLHHSFVLLWNQMRWKIAVYLEQQLLVWKKGNSTLGVTTPGKRMRKHLCICMCGYGMCEEYCPITTTGRLSYILWIFLCLNHVFISRCYKYSIDLWRFVCCANTSFFSYTSWDSRYPYKRVLCFAAILSSRHMILITSALRTCYITCFAASVVNKK